MGTASNANGNGSGDATTIELHPRTQALTLEIILRAVFGLDPGPRLDAIRESLSGMLEFGGNPLSLLGEPPAWSKPFWERLPMTACFFEARNRVTDLLHELIDERRADPGDRGDVLAMLLEARHEDGSPMSREELRDELMTLMLAGHETTASSLAWAFAQLVHNPDALARLAEEVDSGSRRST